MKMILRFLLILCAFSKVITFETEQTKFFEGQGDSGMSHDDSITESESTTQNIENTEADDKAESNYSISNGRMLPYDFDAEEHIEDRHAIFRKRAKPLKSIFMGIYKNYKSTYMGNRTTLEYKQKLRERLNADPLAPKTPTIEMDKSKEVDTEVLKSGKIVPLEQQIQANASIDQAKEVSLPLQSSLKIQKQAVTEESNRGKESKTQRKRKRKHKGTSTNKRVKLADIHISSNVSTHSDVIGNENRHFYNIGPGVGMTLDLNNDIVNVKLNKNNLQEIMNGRWLSDNSEEGRGKKYEMITRILPLFVLPFLIQSAIVPFLVTKLKLLLMKSILVGKLAIFLLIISAIKNSNKMMQTYEVGPSYWSGEPSRRSELVAAASSAAYNGYRVEGKPATWIN